MNPYPPSYHAITWIYIHRPPSARPDLAKVSPHILHPTRFALHLGTHLVSKYAHTHKAFVTVEQLRWARIDAGADGAPHTHAFWRDGDEKKIVTVEVDASAGKDALVGKVEAGLRDLLGKRCVFSHSHKRSSSRRARSAQIDWVRVRVLRPR